jgi:fatty acid-binding protein DegV
VNTSFVIDTLEYLWKGGRCSGVAAFGANLLNLKPCIQLTDGALDVGKKYRGHINKVYEKYITERLTGKTLDPHCIFITTSNELSAEEKEKFTALVRSLVQVDEVFFTRTGCTVTSHCGPGTLGILFLEA